MRITFVLPGYPGKPGGGKRVVYRYASHLTERGHDVTVLHLTADLEPRGADESTFVKLKRIARRSAEATRRSSSAWEPLHPDVSIRYAQVADDKVVPIGDAVIATYWRTAHQVAKLDPSRGAKYYLIQHLETWAGPEGEVLSTWRLPLHKIVVAGWLKDVGLAMGVGSHEMTHITNAVDVSLFKPLEDFDRGLSVGLAWSEHPFKGPQDMLTALRVIASASPDVVVHAYGVGRPPNVPGVNLAYTRRPRPEELVNILNRCSVFLSSSLSEGWGLPGAEAMACGCALVSTANGGVLDYARSGTDAVLTPPSDPDALATAALDLLRDPVGRRRLQEEAVRRMSAFTWQASTAKLEAVLSGSR